MAKRDISLLFVTVGLLLLLAFAAQQAEGKMRLKKIIKVGMALHALGSKRLPRILPIPLPIPLRMDGEKTFGGGHFGNDYYSHQGSGFVPAYGPGGYNLGAGGFGSGVYGGGGYAADGGWW